MHRASQPTRATPGKAGDEGQDTTLIRQPRANKLSSRDCPMSCSSCRLVDNALQARIRTARPSRYIGHPAAPAGNPDASIGDYQRTSNRRRWKNVHMARTGSPHTHTAS